MRMNMLTSRVGKRIARLRRSMLGGLAALFTPQSLFGSTTPGALYQPSLLTDAMLGSGLTGAAFLAAYPNCNLYTTSAGTTPVTAVEQSVGLVLDTKQGVTFGSELAVNGDFTTDTAWTKSTGVTISGGSCIFVNVNQNNGVYQTIITAYKTYHITYTITSLTSGSAIFYVGSNADTVRTAAGTYTATINAGSGALLNAGLFGNAASATNSFVVDNISVREIPGNHLIQATSQNRPVFSKRKNWFLATATLSTQSVSVVAGTHNISFEGAGTITLSGVGSGVLSTLAAGNVVTTTEGTLVCTVAGSVTGAQLERGATRTRYQAVVDASNYDYVGFPGYLNFNGTNSCLYSASTLDLSSTDKVTVWAGVQKLSDAGGGTVVELSATMVSNNGTFKITAPNSAAANLNFSSKGTTQVDNTVTTYTSPVTNVITGLGNISGDSNKIRVNGVQIAEVTTDQGTGAYGNYKLNVGARDASGTPSLFLSGNLYDLCLLGRTATAPEIVNEEQWEKTRTFESPYTW